MKNEGPFCGKCAELFTHKNIKDHKCKWWKKELFHRVMTFPMMILMAIAFDLYHHSPIRGWWQGFTYFAVAWAITYFIQYLIDRALKPKEKKNG